MVKAETFLYFAYGSNMLCRRLRKRAPSAIAIGSGHVAGRRIAFHKVGKDGSGKCDMEATDADSDRVFGVLFRIISSDKPALDHAEGLGTGYRQETFKVHQPAGAIVKAMAYVAIMTDPQLRPYDWYQALVIAGALEHGLPVGYVERLRAFPSAPDPDPGRHSSNTRLLTGPGDALPAAGDGSSRFRGYE